MPVYNTITSAALEEALIEDRSFNGYNGNPYAIPQFSVGAWAEDGSVTLADCTNPAYQKLAGISRAIVSAHTRGLFIQRGVVTGAVTGLGASAGDPIYLGITSGTLSASIPIGPGIVAIQVGVAEPNPTTGLITDLMVSIGGGASSGGGGGGVTPVEVATAIAASQANSYFSGELSATIPRYRAVCWGPGETVMGGDASDPTKIDIMGVTVSDMIPGHSATIQYVGTIQNACNGLGAVAGQPIYLGIGPDGILTLSQPVNPDHFTVIVGYAVPRSGTAGLATDLLLDIQRSLVL